MGGSRSWFLLPTILLTLLLPMQMQFTFFLQMSDWSKICFIRIFYLLRSLSRIYFINVIEIKMDCTGGHQRNASAAYIFGAHAHKQRTAVISKFVGTHLIGCVRTIGTGGSYTSPCGPISVYSSCIR